MSRIRADQLVNRAGSGGPKFPNGVADGFSVSGVVTATSFRGDGSQLTGIDASSLKDGSNVKVQATATGANVTGNVAATGNVTAVDGTFSGNLTVQGTTTTIDTAVTEVDSLNVEGSVGIGTTNATEILHVQTGTSDEITTFKVKTGGRVELSRNHASAPYIKTLMTNGNPNIILGDSVGDRVLINGDGSSYFNGGNIGIGTDNPTELVTVGSAVTTALFEIKPQTGAIDINVSSGDFSPHYQDNFVIYNGQPGSGTERLRVNNTGHILPGADNTQDLGSSSKRWANIYTGDLNLSNEGSANDVDGTWGQYTIQEGEDDLFLINRRTGKKYKFNLTEVD